MVELNLFGSSSQIEMDDRLDAARALLGVSPSSVSSSFGGRELVKSSTSSLPESETVSRTFDSETVARRPRSNSAGLDALALMAAQEQASLEREGGSAAPGQVDGPPSSNNALLIASAVSSSCSSSSDDDSEAMPPPPPRVVLRRRRSVSNPEGMERWAPHRENRLHFVLPPSILEEELAEANAAMKAKDAARPLTQGVVMLKNDASNSKGFEESKPREEDDSNLDQETLLRRARSRLLEDLSEGNINGEKGVLTLPHSLAKYKNVYNKNGRIGIYTRAERAAIIERFNSKRSRRVWNKKIRYNCRKNLADRRMRVKGRFVKRSTEQLAKTKAPTPMSPVAEESVLVTPEVSEADDGSAVTKDEDMPDVNDPEAGFCPTEDQPYRRLRRHTIT